MIEGIRHKKGRIPFYVQMLSFRMLGRRLSR